MKNVFILLSAFVVFGVVSCKSQKADQASAPQSTKDSTVYKGVTDQNCEAEVSFGSPGSGIDGKGYESIIKFIKSKKVAYTQKAIGREGEVRICLPLTELKSKEKKEFIEELKKLVKQSQYTSISIR